MTDASPIPAGIPLEVERRLSAPPGQVYEAWLDPAMLARWMSPVGHAVATVDPRPGGRFRIVMVGEGRSIEHVGRFVALDPGRRLVLTWASSYTGGETLVTVELRADGEGTVLRLRHDRLPADQREPHAGGWGRILDRLAAALG